MQPNTPFTSDPVVKKVPALRDRSIRRPKHSWSVVTRPYRLTPICLAPVMAGDTLKTASYQARALTDPLSSPLRGWHLEFFFFYVRIMDMENGAAIIAKLIDEDQGAYTPDSANANLYHNYGIDWMTRALKLIVPHYFRDYGEDWDEVTESGLPIVQARSHSWLEHYIATSALPADDTDAEDWENLWSKWAVLSKNRLTVATYEEWLRQQGVKPPQNLREPDADLKIPEMIRHYKDWQYPVSTVSPTDGTASNAVSWACNDKIERARRFTEPGFIVGLVLARPKEYLPIATGTSSVWQAGFAAGALNTAKSWIPPVYANEPGESLRIFAAGTGPVGQKATTFEYCVDHRDLFLEGDQYILGTQTGLYVPRRDMPLYRYPTEAGITALFTGANGFVTTEGLVAFSIAGRVRSMSI